ncbi:hypothetical protein [Elioraea tepidiphila]|uniref:hypothetical protein n=1 Tax=Elioraea tepidiphila TaxID=457934 RepID=UPI002FDABD41
MSKLPLLFLATAAACLLAGVGMGIAMGITHDFSLSPVHAHLNLLGWTSLALMGLTLRAYPELLRSRPLAWAQYGLSAGSALIFPAGIYLAVTQDAPGVAIAASLVWFAGVVLFLARLVGLLVARDSAVTTVSARLNPLAR